MCYWFFAPGPGGQRGWFHLPRRPVGRRGTSRGMGVAEEAESFLQGTYAERCRAGGAIDQDAAWVWLNAIAHGPLPRVVELAAQSRSEAGQGLTWSAARALIARDVLESCGSREPDLARLQHDVLIPLELRLDTFPVGSPTEMARHVRGELRRAQY